MSRRPTKKIGEYRWEIIAIIFLALIGTLISFGLRAFDILSPSERLFVDLFIGFAVLGLSVALIMNRNITLLRGIIESYKPERTVSLRGSLRRLVEAEQVRSEFFLDSVCVEGGRYTVSKQMMYPELTKFAKAMSRVDGDEIRAVSSIDISSFQLDPFAADYLNVNVECVGDGIPVRRVFVLRDADLDNQDVIRVVVTQGDRLTAKAKSVASRPEETISTMVKWINAKHLGRDERGHDLAIFSRCIVARQRVDDYEVTFNDEQDLKKAEVLFNRFWTHPKSQNYTELKKLLKQRGDTP